MTQDPYQAAVDAEVKRLEVDRPREGSDRVWAGLPSALRNAPATVRKKFPAPFHRLLRPGMAEVRWQEGRRVLACALGSQGPKDLRRSLVWAAMTSTHAPPLMFHKGSPEVGDVSFTSSTRDIWFARGNVAAYVQDDLKEGSALEIAKILDAALLKETPGGQARLAELLPRLEALKADRTEVQVGATIKVEVLPALGWKDRVGLHLDCDPAQFEAEFPSPGTMILKALKPGTAEVLGSAYDLTTLLSVTEKIEIRISP